MIFPTIMYRCPGYNSCPGGSFDWIAVNDKDEFDKLVADGWLATLAEAMDPAVIVDIEIPPDSAPPTRDELETMAKKLDIPYNSRTTNETLISRIDQALKNVVD